MPQMTAEQSIASLERLLDRRRTQLSSLKQKRNRLQRNLDKVEGRIAQLAGSKGATMRSVSRRLGKRSKNPRPLAEVVVETLAKTKTGLPLGKLADQVLAAGYKSASSNFKNVLYQTLYHDPRIVHDRGSGEYRLLSSDK